MTNQFYCLCFQHLQFILPILLGEEVIFFYLFMVFMSMDGFLESYRIWFKLMIYSILKFPGRKDFFAILYNNIY